MHSHKWKIQRKWAISQNIQSLTLFAEQSPRIFSENVWNSECSLNNPDLVDNRSSDIVVAKIYQELLRYRPTLLFSVLLLIVELLHF